jgi:hypothetical protein
MDGSTNQSASREKMMTVTKNIRAPDYGRPDEITAHLINNFYR